MQARARAKARKPFRKGAYRKVPGKARTRKEWVSIRRQIFARNVVYASSIRYYRIDRDVTQRELAVELGISSSTVTNRESGRVAITPMKISAHFLAVDRIIRGRK